MDETPSLPNNPVADYRFTWGRWWATSINSVGTSVAIGAVGISFLIKDSWVGYIAVAGAVFLSRRAFVLYFKWEDKARKCLDSGGSFFIPSPLELWEQNKSYAIYVWFHIFLYTAFALFGIGLAMGWFF